MLGKIITVDTNTELFRALRPQKCENLTRVGGFKDGGYLVPLQYLTNLTAFVNFGVGEDFDFEIELQKKFGVPKILSYDSLVSLKYFIVLVLKSFIKFFLFKATIFLVLHRLILLLKFFKFYTLGSNTKFFKVKINKFNVDQILSNLPQNSALKVDIEGGEYQILDSISANKSKFNFVIIEFHSIQLNEVIINKFIKALNNEFFCAHLSFNNRLSDMHIFPQTIEVTLCRGEAKFNNFIRKIPNAKLDWHFPDKPIYVLNYD
jgi:hypothetical protein